MWQDPMHVMTNSPASSAPLIAALRTHREETYCRGFIEAENGKRHPTFPSGITAARGQQLADLMVRERPTRTIETGFAFGLSALFILEAALVSNPDPAEVLHTAIDPFQSTDWGNSGVRSFREAGLEGHLRLLQEDSALVPPALCSAGETFDTAFIDGGHLFDGAFVDLFYMLRLVRPGGLIVLDDYWMPSVRSAVDFFAQNLGLEPTPILDEKGRAKMAALRVPTSPVKRAWDHYVPFAT
jgi:predicted O-methyltransferase YrrM